MENSRKLLMQNDVITLEQISLKTGEVIRGARPTVFTITSETQKTGGSAVCYEAECDDGTSGRLKELYPADREDLCFSLVRGVDNCLTIPPALLSANKPFEEIRRGFIQSHCTINSARRDQSNALSNYMPPFELFSGGDTVYVWTRHDKNVLSFSDYLQSVKWDISRLITPEKHLYNILTAIISLTKCASALHVKNLMHLDLKPDNFGLSVGADKKVEAANISLFDINSVCPCDSKSFLYAGSAGFAAREISTCPTTKSDVYSLGAILFTAITVAETNGEGYQDTDYPNIDNLVSNAALMQASDKNADSKLHEALSAILKDCLCDKADKRPNAGQLVSRLEAARALLTSSEKELDRGDPNSARGAIQRLLWEHPVYAGSAGDDLNLLVIGNGTYAHYFIDTAFEMAQLPNHTLKITAVSRDVSEAKDRFLRSRPAFCDFFKVSGESFPEGEEPYGQLAFKSIGKNGDGSFSPDGENNKALLTPFKAENYSYVFIALGDDTLNRAVAESCHELFGIENIYFIQAYKPRSFKTSYKDCGATPVFLSDTLKDAEYFSLINRMAQNVFLLWQPSLNVNTTQLRNRFKNPYHFNSSVANILSLKYKLHSLGIDISNPRAAADEFITKCQADPGIITALSDYEHRRWVVNHVCTGWQLLPEDEYYRLSGDRKLLREKLHPCIVRSTGEMALMTDKWRENGCALWDSAKESDLSTLDQLDRVAVSLHRHFSHSAKLLNPSDLSDNMRNISKILTPYPDAQKAFDKYQLCVNEIIEGKKTALNLHDYYAKSFTDALRDLPSEIEKTVSAMFGTVKNEVYPIRQAHVYLNYKKNDYTLVNGIPFILTYNLSMRLCIPLAIERRGEKNNLSLYSNIASAIRINPGSITYMVDCEDVSDNTENFLGAITYIANSFASRNMQTKIHLVFLMSQSDDVPLDYLKEKLNDLGVASLQVLTYESDDDLRETLLNFINLYQKNKNKAFTAIERNATPCSRLLRGLGIYSPSPSPILPSYRYDIKTSSFRDTNGCEFLTYIKSTDHLRVADMFGFRGGDSMGAIPELEREYRYFWGLYTQNDYCFKQLCAILSEASRINDRIAAFKPIRTNDAPVSYTFFIPAFCRHTAEKILSELKEKSITFTGENPLVSYYTSTTCKVTLECVPGIKKIYDELFGNPYVLSDPSKITIRQTHGVTEVFFDDLRVSGIRANSLPKQYTTPQGLEFLRSMSAEGYLINYTETETEGDKLISFTFASPQIKNLLTVAGRVLELFVYYKVLELSYFDDVAQSCIVTWDNGVSNEFDLIVTKGNRSFIIEIKATTSLDQQYYYKLAQLNQIFGINSTPIIIADTNERPNFDNSANEGHRIRGESLGISTIYARDDIRNIGTVLRDLMESSK